MITDDDDPDRDYDLNGELDSPGHFHRLRVRAVKVCGRAPHEASRDEHPPAMAVKNNQGEATGTPCMITRRLIRVFQLERRHETGNPIFQKGY